MSLSTKLKIGSNVNMERVNNYKAINDALETINEIKMTINDDMEKKMELEHGELPFNFDQGKKIIFYNSIEYDAIILKFTMMK